MNIRRTRRGVLKGGALLGALAAAPQLLASRILAQESKFERHGGFLILPSADIPLPSDVVLSGLLPVLEGPNSNVSGRTFVRPSDARNDAEFEFWVIEPASHGLRQDGPIQVVRNQAGQVVLLAVGYDARDPDSGARERSVEVTATEVFLQPFPVWPTNVDGVTYPPVKIQGLPGPGLMSRSALGFVFQWTRDGRLHQLRVENNSSEPEALALAGSLSRA